MMGYSAFGIDHGGDLFEEVSKLNPRVRIMRRSSPRPANPPPRVKRVEPLTTVPKPGPVKAPAPNPSSGGGYSGRIGSGISGNLRYGMNAVRGAFKKHPVVTSAVAGGAGAGGLAGGYALSDRRRY